MKEKEFLEKIRIHQGIIYKLVHLYAQSAEDKKDLYQEIVLQAWKGYPSFRAEAAFGTWLYKLALNTIFVVQRRQSKETPADTTLFENSMVANHSDEAERLYKAIRTLPDTERAIISLHLDGYGNNEIGEMLGVTANMIGVKLYRAKGQLANLLINN